MTTRIAINGFGRMGRLVVRALRNHPELQLGHINEHKGDVTTAAHLLEFDSVHGRYASTVGTDGSSLTINGALRARGSQRNTSVDEVNEHLRAAAPGELAGILGFEDRPLVSADYTNDTRSGIVDGPSTMVIDGFMVKVLIWHDNGYGYVFRMAELTAKVAASLDALTATIETR